MRTPASIAGHPIHPMLVMLPVGLFIFSLLCDLIALISDVPDTWHLVALYTMVGGFIGALIAAMPGFIDFLSITNERVRKIAIMHMAFNLVAVTLYGVNIWLRVNGEDATGTPLLLSLLGVGLLGISGWLGGSMVYRHGVGVNAGPP
jgi:uncharacterized membrane protein